MFLKFSLCGCCLVLCLFGSELFAPESELLEPFDVNQLFGSQVVNVHGLVQVGELVLLFFFLLFATFLRGVRQEHEFRCVRVFDRQPLDGMLGLSEWLTRRLAEQKLNLLHVVH
jgi:hypothetical protein